MTEYIVVLVTAPTEKVAATIGKALVKAKLAACVNIITRIRSIYTWQGKIYDEPELLMIIKTRKPCFGRLEKLVRSIHPYQVPEIIALPITAGTKKYLKWVEESV